MFHWDPRHWMHATKIQQCLIAKRPQPRQKQETAAITLICPLSFNRRVQLPLHQLRQLQLPPGKGENPIIMTSSCQLPRTRLLAVEVAYMRGKRTRPWAKMTSMTSVLWSRGFYSTHFNITRSRGTIPKQNMTGICDSMRSSTIVAKCYIILFTFGPMV